jgi:acyl carrier protein
VSINWGAWDQLRMGSDEQRTFAQAGLVPMASESGLRILGQLLHSDVAQPIVVSADWQKLKAVYEARRARPLLRELDRVPQAAAPAAKTTSDLMRQLAESAADDHVEILVAYLRDEAGKVLGMGRDQVDVRRGLFEMGMDSLMSVALKSRISAATGLKLPTTLTFNYPTINALAEYLRRELSVIHEVKAKPRPEETVAVQAAATSPVFEDAEDLSEDELAALLAEKLAEIQ